MGEGITIDFSYFNLLSHQSLRVYSRYYIFLASNITLHQIGLNMTSTSRQVSVN